MLAGPVLAELVLPVALLAGVGLTAGELLVLPGAVAVAVADPVAVADGDGAGDGRCEARAPLTPPPRVVPWPGWPWTTADSGLPVACSSSVSGTAQPMNATTMNATGPAQRRCRRSRVCEAAWATTASSSACSGRPRVRIASAPLGPPGDRAR